MQKRFMKVTLSSLVLMSLSLGCGKKLTSDEYSIDDTEATVESATTMISGVADDEAGSSLALRSEPPRFHILDLIRPSVAFAADCTRALYNACQSGVRSADYSQCNVGGLRTLSGNVSLTYSSGACTLAGNGDHVTRTYSVTVNGPRGGIYTLKSESAADYRGSQYGGGGRLTKTASGWDLEVLGRHARFDRNGRNFVNVSTRTLTPIQVSGGLLRANRIANGGQLEVNHNILGYTAVFTASNLRWSNTCCHPIDGSFNVTYSGSRSGTATVQFNSCGSAQVTTSGQTRNVSLSYCE